MSALCHKSLCFITRYQCRSLIAFALYRNQHNHYKDKWLHRIIKVTHMDQVYQAIYLQLRTVRSTHQHSTYLRTFKHSPSQLHSRSLPHLRRHLHRPIHSPRPRVPPVPHHPQPTPYGTHRRPTAAATRSLRHPCLPAHAKAKDNTHCFLSMRVPTTFTARISLRTRHASSLVVSLQSVHT